MKHLIYLSAIMLCLSCTTRAQQDNKYKPYRVWYQAAIGKQGDAPPHSSAWLDIGEDGTSKGVIMPRVNALSHVSSPISGLVVYLKSDSAGFYGYRSGGWHRLDAAPNNTVITSGTYTPSVTAVSSATSLVPKLCTWNRVGNIVTVFGSIELFTPGGALNSRFTMSLPVSSNFTNENQLTGYGVDFSLSGPAIFISAETAVDRAIFSFLSQYSITSSINFSFQYQIL